MVKISLCFLITCSLSIITLFPGIAAAVQIKGLADSVTSICHGVSFGECVGPSACDGICQDEIKISGDQVRYFCGRQLKDPKLEKQVPDTVWSELFALARHAQITPKDSVVGCPDCADNGAEWIEIGYDSGLKLKTTFEYHQYPPGLAILGKKLAGYHESCAQELNKIKAPAKAAVPGTK